MCSAAIDYSALCVTFCDQAEICRDKAVPAGDGAVLGDDVARFLGAVPLQRALELMRGAQPASVAEQDLARRINDTAYSVTRPSKPRYYGLSPKSHPVPHAMTVSQFPTIYSL